MKAVYTAIIGNYDKWTEPKYVNKDFDYYLFTDQNIKSKFYEVLKLPENFKGYDVRTARMIKILPYLFLPEYKLTVWHDANITQQKDLSGLDFSKDITIMKHPHRNCIYQEYFACQRRNKDNDKVMFNQVQEYRSKGYKKNNGLVASGLIIRKNNKRINDLCKQWFTEVYNKSFRDQLSFNYIFKKYNTMPYSIIENNIFNITKHA